MTKAKRVSLTLAFLIFLFTSACSASVHTEIEPCFDFSGSCEIDSVFSGNVSFRSGGISQIETVTPEELSGMTVNESNGIITVEFCGNEKSSEKIPKLKELNAAKILLMLRDLSCSDLNLSSESSGITLFSCDGAIGEYQVTVGADGIIQSVKNTENDFCVNFSNVTPLS